MVWLGGDRSAAYFRGLCAKTRFLATAGIEVEGGLTYPALSDIAVKRAMIAAADRVCLVADASKIALRSFTALGGLDLVHMLITDNRIRDADRAAIEAAGVERTEEHTSELQSLMRISYAVFCLKRNNKNKLNRR